MSDTAKYLVRKDNPNNIDAKNKQRLLFFFKPVFQRTADQVKNASIIVSDITFVLETRKTGETTEISAAKSGVLHNGFAR